MNDGEARILVLAPLARDADIIGRVLAEAGFESCRYRDMTSLVAELAAGAGALLVTEEAMTTRSRELLLAALAEQPAWSDLPLILLLASTTVPAPQVDPQAILPGRTVTILRRPIHISTLVSVVNTALRARERQYELRELLAARTRQAEELERRVAERTAQLTYANAILAEQVEVREKAQSELQQLYRITAAATRSLELQDVLETLAGLLAHALEIPAGAVFLYEKEQNRLALAHSWGLPPESGDSLARFLVADTEFERCLVEGDIVYHASLSSGQDLSGWPGSKVQPGWRSYLCVPLEAQGQVEGVLSLFTDEPALSGTQRVFFETVGRQVGVAVANARLHAVVLARGERLQQLAQRIISIQEEERHRVSRELHDEAGQSLTALLLSLEMLKAELPPQLVEAYERIDEAIAMTGETMEQLRTMAHGLRTPSLDTIGLNGTLEGLCRSFSRRVPFTISYEGTELPALPDETAISLYRVVQEGLTNVARHAQATEVAVSLEADDTHVTLTVTDDGEGFNVAGLWGLPGEGIGLSGLQERIETLGGMLRVKSAPGKGTRLTARVPLEL